MDLVYHPVDLIDFLGEAQLASLEETVRHTGLVSRLMDSHRPFTAMHSAGVRASAVKIAELMGMSEDECLMMVIAGDLHDLGKILVPKEALEKPGRLTTGEFDVIQEHSFHTYQILRPIEGFDQICQWQPCTTRSSTAQDTPSGSPSARYHSVHASWPTPWNGRTVPAWRVRPWSA